MTDVMRGIDKMKIAICENDAEIRSRFSLLMKEIARKRGIGLWVSEYETGTQLRFVLERTGDIPDAILLDIAMPEIDGIDVCRILRQEGFFGAVIYLSRSSDYKLPAFDVGAFNYVIRMDSEGMEQHLEMALERAAEKSQQDNRKYILLNGISEYRNLPIDAILYFESIKHVVTVHYGSDEEFDFICPLTRVEDALGAYGFMRVHNSYLVNTAAVKSFDFKGIELADGTELPIGRKRYPELKAVMRECAVVNLDAGR